MAIDIPMSIEATVDRFEGDFAVLRTGDGQEILWPSEQVPDNLQEGNIIRLALLSDDETATQRRTQAQDILNEIFNEEEIV